jgi:hypothetical protein
MQAPCARFANEHCTGHTPTVGGGSIASIGEYATAVVVSYVPHAGAAVTRTTAITVNRFKDGSTIQTVRRDTRAAMNVKDT